MWLGSPDHFLLRGARCWAQVLPRRSFSNQGFWKVSSPDSTLSCGKGSSDHWVLFFGCAESAVSSQSSIVRCHNYVFTLTNQIGLSWIPNICLFRNQDCWLSTLKKAPKGHQTLFHVRRWGLVCMRGWGLRGLDLGTRLVSLVCALFATYPKVVQFVRKKKILRCYLTYFDTVLLFSDAMWSTDHFWPIWYDVT